MQVYNGVVVQPTQLLAPAASLLHPLNRRISGPTACVDALEKIQSPARTVPSIEAQLGPSIPQHSDHTDSGTPVPNFPVVGPLTLQGRQVGRGLH